GVLLLSPSPACERLSLYRYGSRRALHAFPTRRSSDLVLFTGPLSPVLALWQQRCESRGHDWQPPPRRPRGLRPRGLRVPRPADRSEEHTSELQSRENLVCRLLLEKKKEEHLQEREAGG